MTKNTVHNVITNRVQLKACLITLFATLYRQVSPLYFAHLNWTILHYIPPTWTKQSSNMLCTPEQSSTIFRTPELTNPHYIPPAWTDQSSLYSTHLNWTILTIFHLPELNSEQLWLHRQDSQRKDQRCDHDVAWSLALRGTWNHHH